MSLLAAMPFVGVVVGPGMAATTPAPSAAPAAGVPGAQKQPDDLDQFADMVEELAGRAPGIVRAIPGLPAATSAALTGLDRSGEGGRNTGSFLQALAGWLVALVLIDLLIGLVVRGRCQRLIGKSADSAGLRSTVLAALLELLRPAALLVVSRVGLGVAFAGAGSQTLLAAAVLDAVVGVVAIRSLLEVLLRPTWPAARVVPVEDGQASRLKRGITAVATLARVGQVWGALLAGSAFLPAQLLVTAAVVPLAYGWIVWSKRDVFGTWLGRLFGSGSPAAVARGTHVWLLVMGLLVALALLLRLYAALADRPAVPFGTMATLTVVILLLFGETLVRWVLGHPEAATGRSDVEARLLRSGARLARVLMLLAAGGVLARVWLVDALSIVSADNWPAASRPWWLAAVTAFVGFLTWEAINVVSQSYLTPASSDDSGASHAAGAGSRARTLAPLLRAALLTVTATLFALAVLSILGVNITPLVAGASILGLAISFGSQTLVKDIITGVFYLAEDAFRVGEYIDCGKAKGTVEGFALRSLRLRHQSGQLHTIPFGQLGQVTNFSRDWSTIKITLRFPRDVDLDALRKAAKKIGQQLIDETDYAPDFIEPLKMQGVTEVLDNALVIGFKFTVIPARPSEIQREAMRRLLTDLPKAGLQFAAATPTYIQVSAPSEILPATQYGAPKVQVTTAPAV